MNYLGGIVPDGKASVIQASKRTWRKSRPILSPLRASANLVLS